MAEAISPEGLVGTWMLVEATAVDGEGRPIRPPYGPQPMGRLVLTAAGRMMAVLCDGRTTVPDGETRAYSSYCGNYRIENGCLITTIDAAALPERIGSEEVRKLDMRGTRLVLIPPRRKNGEQREIFWERCGPA
jgi:Lipocalin-like domain